MGLNAFLDGNIILLYDMCLIFTRNDTLLRVLVCTWFVGTSDGLKQEYSSSTA